MRMADRRPCKNVNDVLNGKLINILTEKYLKRGGCRAGRLPAKERWPCVCRYLFVRVLKLMKRPRMKYGKGTNKGMLKVRRRCGTATVKVRLHSTELVRSRKACFKHTYNVP